MIDTWMYKCRNRKRQGPGAGSILAGRVLRLLSGLAALVVLSRILPRSEYGQFALLWTIYQVVSPLISGGLSAALTSTLATTSGRSTRGPVYGVLLALLGGGTLMAAVAYPILPAFAVFLPAGVAILTAEGIFAGLSRFRTAGALVSINAILRVAGLTLGALSTGTASGAFWGLAAAAWASLILEGVVLTSAIGVPASLEDLSGWRAPLAMGGVLSLAGMIGSLGRQLDRFLVAALVGTEALAVYVNGSIENPAVLLIAGGIMTATMPGLARAFAGTSEEDPHEILQTAGKTAARYLHPILWISLWAATDLIAVVFPAEYAGAAQILRIYALLIPLRCLPYGPIFVAAKKPGVVFRYAVVFLATNAVLTVVGVHTLGIAGAAVATVVTNYASVSIYWIAMRRQLDLDPLKAIPLGAWAANLVRSGVCLIPLLLIPGEWEPLWRLAVGGGVYLLSYAAVTAVSDRTSGRLEPSTPQESS